MRLMIKIVQELQILVNFWLHLVGFDVPVVLLKFYFVFVCVLVYVLIFVFVLVFVSVFMFVFVLRSFCIARSPCGL